MKSSRIPWLKNTETVHEKNILEMLRNDLVLSLVKVGQIMRAWRKGQAKYGFTYIHPILIIC